MYVNRESVRAVRVVEDRTLWMYRMMANARQPRKHREREVPCPHFVELLVDATWTRVEECDNADDADARAAVFAAEYGLVAARGV